MTSSGIAADVNGTVRGGSFDSDAGRDYSQALLVSATVGAIDVTATAGSIIMSDAAQALAGTGTVTLDARLGIALARLETRGNLSLTARAGSITDVTTAETANLIGVDATLSATGSLGAAGVGDLDTQLDRLVLASAGARNSPLDFFPPASGTRNSIPADQEVLPASKASSHESDGDRASPLNPYETRRSSCGLAWLRAYRSWTPSRRAR